MSVVEREQPRFERWGAELRPARRRRQLPRSRATRGHPALRWALIAIAAAAAAALLIYLSAGTGAPAPGSGGGAHQLIVRALNVGPLDDPGFTAANTA